MKDDQEIASPLEAKMSAVCILNTWVLDWQEGKQILSSCGMKSPQLSIRSVGNNENSSHNFRSQFNTVVSSRDNILLFNHTNA